MSLLRRNQHKGEAPMITATMNRHSATRTPKSNLPHVLHGADLRPIHPKNPNVLGGYIQITPVVAQGLLDLNKGNRKLKQANLKKLRRVLLAGFWNSESPDPIVINEKGLLDNGQHRLIEVASTGVTIWALVIVGVSSDVINTMDRGAKRTLKDRLEIEEARGGESYAQIDKMVASVKVCMTYDEDGSLEFVGTGNNDSDRFSEDEQYIYFKKRDRYFESLGVWGKRANDRCHRFRGAAPNRLLVVLRHALLECGADYEDVDAFFDELTNKVQPRPQIFVLQKQLEKLSLEISKKSQRHPINYLLGFYVKGWNAFITGREIKVLKYTPGGKRPEKFPDLMVPQG
jgi:hypothetical protein